MKDENSPVIQRMRALGQYTFSGSIHPHLRWRPAPGQPWRDMTPADKRDLMRKSGAKEWSQVSAAMAYLSSKDK